jgi:hypothetical protein
MKRQGRDAGTVLRALGCGKAVDSFGARALDHARNVTNAADLQLRPYSEGETPSIRASRNMLDTEVT